MKKTGKMLSPPQYPAGAEWKLVTISTPSKIESLNVGLHNERRHWGINWRNKQDIVKELYVLFNPYRDVLDKAIANVRRQVTITSVRTKLLDEVDNLKGGCQPWVNALKLKGGIGVIEDDDPEHTDFVVDQRLCRSKDAMENRQPEPPHTEIEVVFLARE